MQEIIIDAAPAWRGLGSLFTRLGRDLGRSLTLARRIFIRDLKARYRQSILGYIWVLLPSVLTTYAFVFLANQSILKGGSTDLPYPLFVLIGSLLWQTWIDAINIPLRTFRSLKRIIEKSQFPPEGILLASLNEIVFNSAVRALVILVAIIYFGVALKVALFFSFIGLIGLVLVGLIIGLLLVPIASLFKDVEQGLPVFLTFLFYISPVAYAAPVGQMRWYCQYNPVIFFINFVRSSLVMVTTEEFLVVCGIVVVMLLVTLVAWVIYRLSIPYLIERL